jgi:hypothetical protein
MDLDMGMDVMASIRPFHVLCAPAMIVTRQRVLGPDGVSRGPWHHACSYTSGPTTETGSRPRRGAQLSEGWR